MCIEHPLRPVLTLHPVRKNEHSAHSVVNLRGASPSCAFGNFHCRTSGSGSMDVCELPVRKTEEPLCHVCERPVHPSTIKLTGSGRTGAFCIQSMLNSMMQVSEISITSWLWNYGCPPLLLRNKVLYSNWPLACYLGQLSCKFCKTLYIQ